MDVDKAKYEMEVARNQATYLRKQVGRGELAQSSGERCLGERWHSSGRAGRYSFFLIQEKNNWQRVLLCAAPCRADQGWVAGVLVRAP